MTDIFEFLESKNIKCTDEQKQIVLHNKGHMAVLSVPGGGKTTVVLARICNLILNFNVKPDEILAITFSRASAKDMDLRFKKTYSENIFQGVNFSTIHSFANWIVSCYNKKFNITERVISSSETAKCIKKIYLNKTKEYMSDELYDRYLLHIGYIKNKILSREEILALSSGELIHLETILSEYEEYKLNNNLYDYDDMMIKAIHILENNAITLDFLQNKFKYIFIDEAQDTSNLQYKLLFILKKPIYTIVGDDDQNLYMFRGADGKTLLNIENHLPDIKKYYMETNFRSQEKIAEFSNKLIKINSIRYKKEIRPVKKATEKIKVIETKSNKQQFQVVTSNLSLQSNHTAILYRNNISALPLAHSLLKQDIDFNIPSYKTGFVNHWVTQDVLALISLSTNFGDIESFSKVYFKLKTFINKNTIQELTKMKPKDIFEYLSSNKKMTTKQKDRLRAIKSALQRASKKPSTKKGLEHILAFSGYYEYIEEYAYTKGVSEKSLTQIIDVIKDIAEDLDVLSSVKNEIVKVDETLKQKTNNYSAQLHLSTLHGSKGLEFDEVFIIGVDTGVLPSISEKEIKCEEDRNDFESEVRLLYVGATRSKNKLTLLSNSVPELLKPIIENTDIVDIVKHNK